MASFSSLGVTTELLFYFFFFFFMITIIYLGSHRILVHINFADNDLQTEHGVALKTIPWNTGDNFTSHPFSFCESKSYVLVLYDMHKKIIPLIKWSSHQIVAFFVSTLSFWWYCWLKFTLFWMSIGCLFVFWRLIWLTLLLI